MAFADRPDSGYEEDFDFLLPNGFIVPLTCDKRSSLGDLKEKLWKKAVELPAANLLRNSDQYVFIGVTKDGVEEEFDDGVHIEDLALIYHLFEVSEPKVKRDISRLNHVVGEIIGVSIPALELMSTKDPETLNFRMCLRQMCHDMATERQTWTMEQKLLFFHSPKFDLNSDLPICTARKLLKRPDTKIKIDIWTSKSTSDHKITVEVAAQDPPSSAVKAAVKQTYSHMEDDDELTCLCQQAGEMYLLKACDSEEYFISDCSLHKYAYIRNCINKNETINLRMVLKTNVIAALPDNKCIILEQEPPIIHLPAEPTVNHMALSWSVGLDKHYAIKIRSLPGRRLISPSTLLYVEAQIFHGNQALSKAIKSNIMGFNMLWTFDIAIESLPRCARLCFTTLAAEAGKTETIGRNWVNMQIFDQNGQLVTGSFSFGVWDFIEGSTSVNNPLGMPGSNIDKGTDRVNTLDFDIIAPIDDTVMFPSQQYIDGLIEEETRKHPLYSDRNLDEAAFRQLDRIYAKDPLRELTKNEALILWQNRILSMDYQPNILPRLIQTVNWSNRHQVFELYRLLKLWPHGDINLVTVLQLLGPEYPDIRVRCLAVKWMDMKITKELLQLYLPQLTQAIKFESYKHNDLSRYLLYEALFNKDIGQSLFWHMRSEMYNALSRTRFATLLEAYCLYCGAAIIKERQNEVKSMHTYKELMVQIKATEQKDFYPHLIKNWLLDSNTASVVENCPAILDNTVQLGNLCLEECKVMQSNKKPLYLTWKNRSYQTIGVGRDKVKYIIKDGDDLRQDMLVLQLLNVMDMLWKYRCHDYSVTVYKCMPMDENFGIIEVVCDACTICDIELGKKKKITGPHSLHSWLYKTTGGGEMYMKAVKLFTYSCAAYCVATYILGIGDRHSDNLMIKLQGQLFHIDFGHFMNHRKSKGGINRERTPFVLVEEFVRIMNKGDPKRSERQEFDEFLYLCFEAFMTLRLHSNLLLTLLSMMMHCDLPELRERKDIEYCRKSLGLDKPDYEAAKDFYRAVIESYNGRWKTDIDWFFHRFNRVMKLESSGSS